VLEIARALAADARANPDVPARTQVFLLVTGEEMGLLGTDHYLENPVRPLAETVCNLNFEMIGRPDDAVGGAGRLWLTGFERTSLGEAFRAAGLALMPDPRLDQHFFERSDNYAFAKRGIVAQTLSSYAMHEDYHRVTDEADTLDYAHLEAAVRAAFLGARALANGEVTPAWKPGGRPD
jgi:Zn-dependent M28 family amino/carboxypeptidase